MGPPYLSEMCLPISSLPGRRHLRSAVRGQLAVPFLITNLQQLAEGHSLSLARQHGTVSRRT